MGRSCARFTLVVLGALIGVVPSLTAQDRPAASPVTAELRFSGEQRAFKLGEPIRLELVLTETTPGFVVDTAGTDHATDTLTVSPAEGFHRLQPIRGRDYLHTQNLLPTPTVLEFAVNHWLRFDRAGTYTVSLQTNRVWTTGSGGSLDRQEMLPLTTNAVTVRIEATSADDEQALLSAASQRLQSAMLMGPGDRAFAAQNRAAEELAFLPGDLAAIEKYRWYRQLTTMSVPSNALHIVRRGFSTTRNQGLILAEIEAELDDLSRPVTAEMIGNAAMLATMIKHPDYQMDQFVAPTGLADPFSIERARYLDMVHASLDRRVGLVKLQSAGAMLDVLSAETPPDVVRMIIEGFEQLPASTRSRFASGRWETIRDARLGPALRRTLDEVEPGSRSYVYPALIDIAPELAVEPLSRDILDPARMISVDVVRKVPSSSLSHIAPDLLALITAMSNRLEADSHPDRFRIDQKVRLLEVVADGAVRAEIRALYDAWPPSSNSDVRTGLLRYLLQFDPEEGIRRARQAIQDSTSLYALASHGAIPAVSTLLQERLFDLDAARAAEAATLLASHGRAEDRDGIEVRLLQWRLDRQQRFSNGEALTDADGVFEAELVSALARGHSWQMSASDQDRLVANCLTAACKVALRPRDRQ